jgi:hypothetical protein
MAGRTALCNGAGSSLFFMKYLLLFCPISKLIKVTFAKMHTVILAKSDIPSLLSALTYPAFVVFGIAAHSHLFLASGPSLEVDETFSMVLIMR